MSFIDVAEKERNPYNKVVNHPLQSFEWGIFRESTGVKVIRRALTENNKIIDGFTLTIHKVPKTNFTIGYLPKGNPPTKETLGELRKIGKENNCIFIQLEPNVTKSASLTLRSPSLKKSFHPLFTKYTFVLNIQKSEEELLKSLHSKTRYNIRVAQKHEVRVEIQDSEKAFNEYLRLTSETTNRQRFYAHTPEYHKKMWEILSKTKNPRESLSSKLLTATYKNKTLVSWILFIFHDTLYYPYGASSSENRNVMASNLIMWEAIKFGKELGLKYFDMWGAIGPNPDTKDPWYGFHKFKEGYGANLTEFVGSYDLIIQPKIYEIYKVTDRIRWAYLKLKKRFQI